MRNFFGKNKFTFFFPLTLFHGEIAVFLLMALGKLVFLTWAFTVISQIIEQNQSKEYRTRRRRVQADFVICGDEEFPPPLQVLYCTFIFNKWVHKIIKRKNGKQRSSFIFG